MTPMSILVLCTGNSARSILAEALLNREGQGRITAYSAGSQPTGKPNPFAVARLAQAGIDTGFARSKSWDEFEGADAPALDLVITVCDSAAAESCPYFPGAPLTVHWGLPDPAAATGSDAEIALAFDQAFGVIERRVKAFCALGSVDLSDPGVIANVRAVGAID